MLGCLGDALCTIVLTRPVTLLLESRRHMPSQPDVEVHCQCRHRNGTWAIAPMGEFSLL
jgi:hypothetical protein